MVLRVIASNATRLVTGLKTAGPAVLVSQVEAVSDRNSTDFSQDYTEYVCFKLDSGASDQSMLLRTENVFMQGSLG